jgi:GNAT superfamily N-acetyltransferase
MDAPESFRATEEEMRAKPIETFGRQLTPREGEPVFIGAFEGDVLVGVAALFFQESSKLSHKATVGSVFVIPGHRRKGIGRGLISELLRIARGDKKLKQLNLTVNTANQSAVKLYQDLGFSVFGTEPNAAFLNGKGYDEHHMQCVL